VPVFHIGYYWQVYSQLFESRFLCSRDEFAEWGVQAHGMIYGIWLVFRFWG